jgi:hypothetical protein
MLLWVSIAASIISTASSWFFYSRWNEVEEGHYELLQKNSELSSAYNLMELALDSVVNELSITRDPMYKVVQLRERSALGREAARIWWNPYNRNTSFDPLTLPALAGDSVYRIWCKAGGTMVLVGSFKGNVPGGQLLSAGKVAAAEEWFVHPSAINDTVPPAGEKMMYSSGR